MAFIPAPAVDLKGIDPRVVFGAYADVPGGKVRFVQSTHLRATDTKNRGLNPAYPLATLAKAVALSLAHDTIIMLPGHVEVVSTANGLDINKPLYIYGRGGETLRPKIKVGTLTTANVRISGAGAQISNFDLVTDVDALASALQITAAGVRVTDFRAVDSASKQANIHVELAVGANYAVIQRMDIDDETAGSVSAVKISGACDQPKILDCNLGGDFSSAPIDVTAAATRIDVGRNLLRQLNASGLLLKCGAFVSTGLIHDNRGQCYAANLAAPFAALVTIGSATWAFAENYASTVATAGPNVPFAPVVDA